MKVVCSDVSTHRKAFISQTVSHNVRIDGRSRDERREVTLTHNFPGDNMFEVEVSCCKNKIVVGLYMSIEHPDTRRNDLITINVNKLFGDRNEDVYLYSSVIRRFLMNEKTIDTKKLSIINGIYCWKLVINVSILFCESNALELMFIGIRDLLMRAEFKHPKHGFFNGMEDHILINKNEDSADTFTLQDVPVFVSVFKVGENLIVDPTREEEEAADSVVYVGVHDNSEICFLSKKGGGHLSCNELFNALSIAKDQASYLINTF